MHLVCLDVEGVLTPEIWINVAEKTNIERLKRTTRDEPDYDVLMRERITLLNEHALSLNDIQDVIKTMHPLPGAKEFLDELREQTQVVLLSDTFTQFALPLMKKLGMPALLCNELVVDDQNMITGYRLRQRDGKRKAVAAFKSLGYDVIAAGDSYNDTGMLSEANKGILFNPPQNVAYEFPQFSVTTNYKELLETMRPFLA